jgi:hypothetical protein
MDRSSSRELEDLATALAAKLCSGASPAVSGDANHVARTISRVLAANFAQAEEIEREARRTLERLGTETAGLDKGALLAGIRQRLAKQKGFVL